MCYFQVITTNTDDSSLAVIWVIIKVSGHHYRWLAGGYDLQIGHFQWLAWWLPGALWLLCSVCPLKHLLVCRYAQHERVTRILIKWDLSCEPYEKTICLHCEHVTFSITSRILCTQTQQDKNFPYEKSAQPKFQSMSTSYSIFKDFVFI